MVKRWKIKGLLSFLFALIMLLSILPMPAFAEDTADYFGFHTLTDERHRGAYNAIYNGVKSKKDSINLSPYNLTENQFDRIVELYCYDHSEHYWFPLEFEYSKAGNKVTAMILKNHYLTGFNDAVFEAAVKELLRAADGKTSDYDKALALHDALVKHITYQEAPNAHNAYGAIVDRKAVCEGYAEAYQILLQRVGIQSYIVGGTSKGERHKWNIVRLDGKYYYTDVTWDDPVGGDEASKPVYYPYFNITTERLKEDHVITDTYGILPNCTDESKMYAEYTKLSTFTVDAVASALKTVGSQRIARIYNTGNQDFSAWLTNNANDIASKMGLSNWSFRVNHVGRESYLIFSGDVTCTHADKKQHNAKTSTCTDKGWEMYFSCNGCKQLFAANGTTQISEIPYLELAGHTWATTLSYTDGIGHYYGCTKCSDGKGNFVSHSGTDDNDCTTAVTCKCGFVISAVKTHTFGDDRDTTCNNAGCDYTRQVDTPPVDGETQQSPETEDFGSTEDSGGTEDTGSTRQPDNTEEPNSTASFDNLNSSHDKDGASTGVVGAIVGVAAVVCAGIFAFLWFAMKKKS